MRHACKMRSQCRVELLLDDAHQESFVASGDSTSSDVVVLEAVRGRHPGPPTRGVFARWIVHDSQLRAAFEASRSDLFNLRRRHIDSFVCDLLLKPVSAVDEYVVVGL